MLIRQVMLVPLALLALGAVFAGMAFTTISWARAAREFWRASIFVGAGEEGHLPVWVELAPLPFTILGFACAFYYYILHPDLPKKLADRKGMLYLFLYNKWYFDELYDFLFVRPALAGPLPVEARRRHGDRRAGAGRHRRPGAGCRRGAVRLQTGYVYHYALAMLLGVVALATWFVLCRGRRAEPSASSL